MHRWIIGSQCSYPYSVLGMDVVKKEDMGNRTTYVKYYQDIEQENDEESDTEIKYNNKWKPEIRYDNPLSTLNNETEVHQHLGMANKLH